MPPRTALSTPLRGWKCPSCSQRTFSTSQPLAAVGPEHPRYIDIPEPPQQTAETKQWMKGILPVPRDVTSRKVGKDGDFEKAIEKSTRDARPRHFPEGSREAWKLKMHETRKRNLREGLKELKLRKERTTRRLQDHQAQKYAERAELISRPEREDERLTNPSHNLDLLALYKGPVPNPTGPLRLAQSRANQAQHFATRQAARLDSLHTLYSHARTFIVNPKQLDAAVDEAFGTNEDPKEFSGEMDDTHSVWGLGKPQSVQDMLDRANRAKSGRAMEGASGYVDVSNERVRRIAEALTGGRMDGEEK